MSAGNALSPQNPSAPVNQEKREQLASLWDEYKYRHGLCWDAVYKVTAAVVALGMVPYINRHLEDQMDWYLLLPPILGTIFAWFSFRLIEAEFSIWQPVRNLYSRLQRQYCVELVSDVCERKTLDSEFATAEDCKKEFGRRLTRFLICLFALSLINVAIILFHVVSHVVAHWLPKSP